MVFSGYWHIQTFLSVEKLYASDSSIDVAVVLDTFVQSVGVDFTQVSISSTRIIDIQHCARDLQLGM